MYFSVTIIYIPNSCYKGGGGAMDCFVKSYYLNATCAFYLYMYLSAHSSIGNIKFSFFDHVDCFGTQLKIIIFQYILQWIGPSLVVRYATL